MNRLKKIEVAFAVCFWFVGVNLAPAALVGHYTFEEGAGAITADLANPDGTPTPDDVGTLRNSPSWVTGKVGNFALRFNATTANQDVLADDSITNFAYDSLNGAPAATIAAWVNVAALPTSSLAEIVVMRRGGSNVSGEARAVLRVLQNGGIQVGGRSLDQSSGAQTLNSAAGTVALNQWMHIAGIVDVQNDSLKLYVNGSLIGQSPTGNIFSTATFPNANGDATLIGSNGGSGNYLNATIDEVRIYNEALSDSQIAVLAAVPEPSTLALAAGGLLGLALFARRRLGIKRN